MRSQRLLALLAFCFATVTLAVDSEGNSFVFAFVRNANPDTTNQVLSATVLNRFDTPCDFTLVYRPDYHKATAPVNLTQTIPPNSAVNIPIPSWYGFKYTSTGVQDDAFLTLTAYSTAPVTVLANNYDNTTQQGDTYMVLPMTWGSTSLTFSLPPATVSATKNHYEQVFVLPTTPGNTSVTLAEIGNAQSVIYFTVQYGQAPAAYVGTKTPDSRPRTYHVMSDKPVLIVAGVTCAGKDENTCDHTSYMPHPQAANDCYSYDFYDDDHLSYLPTTTQFFTDIPGSCTIGQKISWILNDGTSDSMVIKPSMESPLKTIKPNNPDTQKGVAFHNGGSNIHVARYFDGTISGSRGVFMATSPSITQFHTEFSSFYTRNANDNVEIFCTILSCAALTLDGNKFFDPAVPPITQKVDGVSYYLFSMTIPNAGFHKLDLTSAKGNYAFFVSGKNGQYSYGYEGGLNKPTVVLAPTTPAPTGTTTTGTTGPTTPTKPVTTGTTASVATLGTTGPVTVATTTKPVTGPVTPAPTGSTVTTASPVTPQVTTQTTTNPPVTTSPTTATNAPQTSSTTNVPVVTTSTVAPVVTTTTVGPVVTTSTAAPATSPTTQPVAITTSTQPPVQTTKTTVAQQTTSSKSPVVTVTSTVAPPASSPSTVTLMTILTTQSAQPSTVTTVATVTTPTTPPATSTATTTVTVPTVTTTKPTVPPVTTTTAPPSSTPTTPTTKPTTKTTKTTKTTVTTPTTPTTSTIPTTTLGASTVSVVLSIAISMIFFFN